MRRILIGFACALAFFVAPTDAQAQGRWLRAESDHFIVYSEANEAGTLEAVRQLEGFDRLLRFLTRVDAPPSNKLTVYLFSRRQRLFTVRPNLPQETAGFYGARLETIAAFALFRTGAGVDRTEILFHEYAHHFMHQHFGGAFPSWYVEGFAEYVQTASERDGAYEYGRYSDNRAYWLTEENWISLETLLTARALEVSGDDRASFYALSWLVVHYLYSDPARVERLRALLLQRADGAVGQVAAIEAALGVTLADLRTALRRYARGRMPYHRLRMPAVAQSDIQLTRLPPGADDLLLWDARIRMGFEPAEAVAEIRRLAARAPADPFAQRALARAEAMAGDPAAARALLTSHLAAQPNDADAHYLIGCAWLREARETRDDAAYAAARAAFASAFRLDDSHVPTLFLYASAFAEQGQMNEQRLDIVLRANELAPQVDEIAVFAAYYLIEAGRFEEAAIMLRPVVNGPHAQPSAELRALLTRAEAGPPPPRPPALPHDAPKLQDAP